MKATKPARHGLFVKTLEGMGVPSPVREFRFHPVRQWRVDFFWDYSALFNGPLALEVEGGAWISGRHNRPIGFAKDMEKYRELTFSGIWLLRYQPNQLLIVAVPDLVRIFGLKL